MTAQEWSSLGEKHLSKFAFRKTIAFGHTFVLLVIFFPPVIFCSILGSNIDGIYFAGRKVYLAMVLVILLGMLFPFCHILAAPKRSTSLIYPSVWIPCALLFIAVSSYEWFAHHAEFALYSRDCYVFEYKRDLNRAYQVAEQIYDACVLRPGMVVEEMSVRDCPMYMAAQEKWAPQFRYLETLEQRFHCAGICRSQPSKRLWDNAGINAPSCALYSIQWLHGAVLQCRIISWYVIFLAIAVIPLRLIVLDPLIHHFEDLKDDDPNVKI